MNGDDDVSARAEVLAALHQAGLHPTPDEVEVMVTSYPFLRAGVDHLYDLPGVRYQDPAITVRVRPEP